MGEGRNRGAGERGNPSELLVRFAPLLTSLPLPGEVLDLACGRGRNAAYLAGLKLDVVCADRSAESLAAAREAATDTPGSLKTLEVDLEAGGNPLPRERYKAVVVFNYLHRPLFPHIRAALLPGGIVIYETFTVDQAALGKPTNPDFLLEHGELARAFAGYEILHESDGLTGDPPRAVASLVCRKPGRG